MLFGKNEVVFETNTVIFGTNTLTFATNTMVFGTNTVVFGTNTVLFGSNSHIRREGGCKPLPSCVKTFFMGLFLKYKKCKSILGHFLKTSIFG